MALTDNLTSLNNRRYLWEKAPDFLSLAISQKVPISSVMIDFDDFKKINDTYGHQAGDDVLKQASSIIRNFFRKSDLVIRFGGEEILVILFNSNLKNTNVICSNLKQTIAEFPFKINNHKIGLTISIGIGCTNFITKKTLKTIEDLIEEADMAMYYSKANGKNQINIYTEIKNKKRGNNGSGTDQICK